MDLHPDFRDLLEELAHSAVEFLVVGGYAVAFHGRPRATKDIDILVEGSASNLERVAHALARFGAPPNVVEAVGSMQEDEIVFLGQPPLRVDFLRSIDGVDTAELFAKAVKVEVDGTPIPFIALDHLIANKRAAGGLRIASTPIFSSESARGERRREELPQSNQPNERVHSVGLLSPS